MIPVYLLRFTAEKIKGADLFVDKGAAQANREIIEKLRKQEAQAPINQKKRRM